MTFRIKTTELKPVKNEPIEQKLSIPTSTPIILHSKDLYTEEQAEVVNIMYSKRGKNNNSPMVDSNMEQYRKNLIGEEKSYSKEVIIYDPITKKWKLINV